MEDYVYGQPAPYLIVSGGFIILIYIKHKNQLEQVLQVKTD